LRSDSLLTNDHWHHSTQSDREVREERRRGSEREIERRRKEVQVREGK
jgi:hypothetical protein